ncbi:MAG: GIY-YIG nuclease family protein [Patescibacteria group bacterium]
MNGFVYILLSYKDGKTYTGSTDNLKRRLTEHNSGKVVSTKNRRPLKLIYEEAFSSLRDARAREQYFKNCAGRKKLKELLKDKL